MNARSSSFRTGCFAALAARAISAPLPAAAGGFEMTPAGARANGRGGSEFASGDSAMSLFYNPAGPARVNAPATIDGAFHLHFNRRCYAGFEVDESTTSASTSATYPELCGETGLSLLPEIAGTVRLRDDLVLGLGVYVPTAGARHITFGNVDTGEFDPDGSGPSAAIAPPARHQLMESELLQPFPSGRSRSSNKTSTVVPAKALRSRGASSGATSSIACSHAAACSYVPPMGNDRDPNALPQIAMPLSSNIPSKSTVLR